MQPAPSWLTFLSAGGVFARSPARRQTPSCKLLRELLSKAGEIARDGVLIAACDGMTLRISDSGEGMGAADVGKAMEMFAQLDGRFRRRFGGTGVGLPLSKRLVELHQGSLGISSRLGKGTVVTIRLPPERVLAPIGSASEPI